MRAHKMKIIIIIMRRAHISIHIYIRNLEIKNYTFGWKSHTIYVCKRTGSFVNSRIRNSTLSINYASCVFHNN